MTMRRLTHDAVSHTLGVSPSTLGRSLKTNALSSDLRARILLHFPGLGIAQGGAVAMAAESTAPEKLEQILQLLQDADNLIEGIKSRVVSLADVVQGGT